MLEIKMHSSKVGLKQIKHQENKEKSLTKVYTFEMQFWLV